MTSAAAEFGGAQSSGISKCCSGEHKSAYGFGWRRAEVGTENAAKGVSGLVGVGTSFLKAFPGNGIFLGRVTNVYQGFYHVRYTDGDEEDLNKKELHDQLAFTMHQEKISASKHDKPKVPIGTTFDRTYKQHTSKLFQKGNFAGSIVAFDAKSQKYRVKYHNVKYNDGMADELSWEEIREHLNLQHQINLGETVCAHIVQDPMKSRSLKEPTQNPSTSCSARRSFGPGNNRVSVLQIDLETNKVVRAHVSMASAAAEVGGAHHSNISECCSGKLKSAYGFGWRRSEKNIPTTLEHIPTSECLLGIFFFKAFPGEGIVLGQVAHFDKGLYHVRYTDGEEEDLNKKQLHDQLAFTLYQGHQRHLLPSIASVSTDNIVSRKRKLKSPALPAKKFCGVKQKWTFACEHCSETYQALHDADTCEKHCAKLAQERRDAAINCAGFVQETKSRLNQDLAVGDLVSASPNEFDDVVPECFSVGHLQRCFGSVISLQCEEVEVYFIKHDFIKRLLKTTCRLEKKNMMTDVRLALEREVTLEGSLDTKGK
jgi:hypothetical protein